MSEDSVRNFKRVSKRREIGKIEKLFANVCLLGNAIWEIINTDYVSTIYKYNILTNIDYLIIYHDDGGI